jgi:hypothetical protein
VRFTLICPAHDSEVDGDDAGNEGFSRSRVVELLDTLRERHRWPYEVVENARPDERKRFYRDEAVPAAASQDLSLEAAFGPEQTSRFGAAVPALIAFDAAGTGVGVYPSRAASGEILPIVGYLRTLLEQPD